MEYTKPFSQLRSYQVEEHTGSAVYLEDLHADVYHDDLNKAIQSAKGCKFEDLPEYLEEIDKEIQRWAKWEQTERINAEYEANREIELEITERWKRRITKQ